MNRKRIFLTAAILFLLFSGFLVAQTVTKGFIGKQDFSLWDGGSTKTFTRQTSEGYDLTLNKVDWPGVDVLQVYGAGASRSHTTITAAVSATSASRTPLWLSPGTWTIGANTSFAALTTPVVPPGAIFSVSSGFTLTFASPYIEAGGYQIFSGSGSVAFAEGSELRLSWFATLPAAVGYIGSANVKLLIDRSETISADLTVPANIVPQFVNGTALTVASTKTLTFSGRNIEAPGRQVFAGSGELAFADGTQLKSSWFASLSDAIGYIDSDKVLLLVDKSETVSADLTIPTNVELDFVRGSVLTVATAKTLTINGALRAGPHQIFTLSGTGVAVVGAKSNALPQWWGALADGSNDDTAAIQAAIDSKEAAGGGIAYCIPGTYKTTSTLTIAHSGVFLKGAGAKATVFAPNFDTTPFITFDKATLMERAGIYDCEIAHTITRTAGPTIKLVRGYRFIVQDVEITGAFNGLQYGDASYLLQTIDSRLIRLRINSSDDGIIVTGQASLFLEGCRLNGTPGNSSKGIKVTGAHDGLWLDDTTTIEEHDNSFQISHTSGSVANIFLNGCAFDRPRVAAFRVDISGTASINGVYANGVKIYDTIGAGDTDGILVSNSGSGAINGLEFRGISARDIRQRFANINAIVTDLVISNCVSLRGGVKTVNNYPGIDLNSLAHDHVTITGNRIGSSHIYGLVNGVNATNIVVTGNNFIDNDTGSQNNMGGTSASRVIANNI